MQSFIDDQGIERFLGNISPEKLKATHPVYGDTPTQPMVARLEWPRLIAAMGSDREAWFLPPVADQNGYGMCNASATATAIESARRKLGLPHVQLSAGDLYYRICGGRDNGSTLEDGLAEATAEGVASVAVVPYMEWRRSGGQAAKEDRQRFRVLEYCLLPTFEHCISAVFEGFDIISGVLWYNNYTPGADGWLPRGRGGAGGHAIYGYKPAMRDGKFGIWHQNSWTKSWGLGGALVLPEDAYEDNIGGWWGIRAVVREEIGIPGPKE